MKNLVCILLILISILTACQQRSAYPPAMQQAETLMDTRPDSALFLLESMADTLTMLPEEARMYHQLLTIQAKDKQYITHTGDSLINRIVDFYENHGDKDRLMMAYFYQGSTYRDMNDAPRALKAFQQAVDLSVPNLDLLAKTYNQMGTLFMYQGLHDEVIRVNRKSMEAYLALGKRNKISYAQRDIARMYDVKNMSDSALYYYKEACRTALLDGDSMRYYEILGELGVLYYNVGETKCAEDMLTTSVFNLKNRYITHVLLYLGHIYRDKGQVDSAKIFYRKVLHDNDVYKQVSANHELSKIAIQENDTTAAIKHLKRACLLKDSINILEQTEAIAKINSLYNYQHIESENERLKLERRDLIDWLMVSFFSFFLIISYILFYVKHNGLKISNKKMKFELFEKDNDILSNSSSIEENNTRIIVLNKMLQDAKPEDELQKKLLEIEKGKLNLNNQKLTIENDEKETRMAILSQSEIFLYFHRIAIEDIKVTTEHWEQLQLIIDQTYPIFTKKIKMLYPQISPIECQVCWLSKIGIAPTNIAKLINRTPSGVSNIRSRLYKKLRGTSGTSKMFYDFIVNLS